MSSNLIGWCILFLLYAQILLAGNSFLAVCPNPIGWLSFLVVCSNPIGWCILFLLYAQILLAGKPFLAVCLNSKYYWLANLFLLCSQILLAGVPFLLCSQVLLAGLTFIVDCPNPIGWQTFFCCVLKFYWLAYLSIVVCSISIGWLLLSPTLTSWFHHCKTYRGSAPRPIPQQAPVLFGIIHAVSKTHISKPRQRLSAS